MFKINAKILVVAVILSLGLGLILHNYAQYPQRGASADEYTYSFLGLSLIKDGVPASWSHFSAYKNKYSLTINNAYFPVVYPYFDHPPLNGLLVASVALLNGESEFYQISLATIRLVPIFLFMVTSILVFLIGKKLYGYKTGLWALLINTTTPIIVMNARVVFAENLLTPLFLLALYLYILFKDKLKFPIVFLLGTLSGLAIWTKELGIIVFISLLYLFIEKKQSLRLTLLLISTTLLFGLGYVLYGAYYDWGLFKDIVTIQSTRNIGPDNLLILLFKPIIVNKEYYDGWYFLGLLSIFTALIKYTKHKIIIVPAIVYFLLLIISASQDIISGWYMIPMFPLMSLLVAALLVESQRKFNWYPLAMLLFVGLAQIKLVFEPNFGLVPSQFRVFMVVMFLPLIGTMMFQNRRVYSYLVSIWFYLFILGNVYLTYNYVHPA